MANDWESCVYLWNNLSWKFCCYSWVRKRWITGVCPGAEWAALIQRQGEILYCFPSREGKAPYTEISQQSDECWSFPWQYFSEGSQADGGPQIDIGSCWGFWVLITQVLAWLQLLKSGSIAPSLPTHLCSLWKAESEIRVNLSPMNWGHWVPSPKGNLLKAAARLFLSVKVGQIPESFGGLESLPDSPKSQMAGQQLSPLGVCPPPTHLCRSSLQALSCTSGGEYKCLSLDSHMPYLAGIFYIFRWKLFMACDPGHWRAQKTTDLWQAWRATILAALSLLSVGNLFLNDLSVIYGSQRAGVNSILSN